MRKQTLKNLTVSAMALAAVSFGATAPNAAGLEEIFKVSAEGNKLAKASQTRIDAMTDETSKLLGEYKQVLKEIDGLKVYNTRLLSQIKGQEKELEEIRGSIERVTFVERQITPLMIRMIDTLDEFIVKDVPFNIEERKERVLVLRDMMDRADVSPSEKFRRVFEAYQIESEFGRTIEGNDGVTINLNGTEFTGNQLRIGRVGLYFVTPDGSTLAMWNRQSSQWTALDASHRQSINDGLKIANQQSAPALVRLPVIAE